MKIQAIAANTFREAIREKVLYLLLFFAAASLILSQFLALLTVGDKAKIIKDVGLASLSLFGMLIAVIIGTTLVSKEIDKKTLYSLISRPINRYQFILGKFFGLILVLLVALSLMSITFLVIIFFHTFTVEWKMLMAILFIFFELCLLTSVAIFFSCLTTPILSSVFSLSFYIIGHLSWGLETLIKKMKPGAGKILIQILYTVLPDLENLNFKTEVVHNLPLPIHICLYSSLYAIFYTLFVLFLSIFIFRKKDFL